MSLSVWKTQRTANDEAIQIIYDSIAGKYKLQTYKSGSGSDYPLGIVIGSFEADMDTSGNFYPLTNNTGSLGKSSNKWSTIYVTTVHEGDVIFANDFRLTESPDDSPGLEFYNKDNELIAKLDKDGNFFIKGTVQSL